jgi:hypothetical protein
LVHDWAPNDSEGDKVLYVFDCGELGEDESRIKLDHAEIDTTEWVEVNELGVAVSRFFAVSAITALDTADVDLLDALLTSPGAPPDAPEPWLWRLFEATSLTIKITDGDEHVIISAGYPAPPCR